MPTREYVTSSASVRSDNLGWTEMERMKTRLHVYDVHSKTVAHNRSKITLADIQWEMVSARSEENFRRFKRMLERGVASGCLVECIADIPSQFYELSADSSRWGSQHVYTGYIN